MRIPLGGTQTFDSTATAIGSLSVSTGASAAQVVMTPGFWKKGTGSTAWYRTQMMLQGTIVQVTGTTRIGVNFSSVGYDAPGNMRLGAIATRRAATLAALYSASWTYGIAPIVDTPTWLHTDLTPGSTYFVEWRTTHPCSDPVGASAAFDTHEEPANAALSESATAAYSGANNGFWNFTGFYTDKAASFSNVTLARTLKYVLIHSDSNGEGRLTSGASTTGTFAVMEHRNNVVGLSIGDTAWDKRGALGQYQWLMLDSNGTTNSYHWAIIDQSYGGCWQGKMGATWRGLQAVAWPGLWKDVVTRMKWRTNYSTTDFTAGGDWTGGVSPHLVWFTSFHNDTIQQKIANGFAIDAGFGGSTQKDNVGKNNGTPESLIHLAYTTWATAAVFVNTHQSNDTVYAPIDTKTQTNAACATDTNYYKLTGAGGTKFDANKGRFFDFETVNGTTGISTGTGISDLHPNYEQHVLLAAAMQSTLNALSV